MLFAFVLAVFLVSCCVFVYGLAIKGVDSYEPEPWWMLVACFFWGALGATFFSLIFNTVGQLVLSTASDPRAASMLTATLVAPPVEESFKAFGLLVVWALSALWTRDLDGPLDGAIYGGIIGLGFTLTEDVLYIMNGTAAGGKLAGAEGATVAFVAIFILRTILGGLGHATFTAMTGLGVGIAAESRSVAMKIIAPVGGWCAAVGLHSLHNLLASFFVPLKFLVFLSFGFVFFVLLFVLAFRDRRIVLRELAGEVGRLLHPLEYKHTTSSAMVVPTWNLFALMGSPGGYGAARKKQLQLVDLAFVKHRQRRGESDAALLRKEGELRAGILAANQRGVFVGKR